jgi:hypothetical protein
MPLPKELNNALFAFATAGCFALQNLPNMWGGQMVWWLLAALFALDGVRLLLRHVSGR